jgi:hypothetical protein
LSVSSGNSRLSPHLGLIERGTADPAPPVPVEPSVHGRQGLIRVIHHPVFERFQRWSGEVDSGRSVNFLGVCTRDEFMAGMTGVVAAKSRWVETDYPPFDEEYLEWVDVLEAVVSAVGVFTMIELGAGWGR